MGIAGLGVVGGGVGTALGGTAVSYALATGGAVAGTSSSMIGTALNSNGNAGFSEYMLSGGFGGAMGGLNAVGSIAGLGSGLIGAGIGAQYGNASLGFQIGDMAGGIAGGGIADFGRAIGKGALHWGAIGHAARRIGVEGGFTLGGGAVGYAATGTMDGALMGASMGQAIGGAFANFAVACFTAGTPLVVDLEGNSRPIDEIEVGDFVLARSEFDPDGPLELKRVEEKFVRTAVVMELVVRGRSIKTTVEHPFFVPAQGKFVAAGELQVGEQLVGHDGKLVQIESIGSTDEVTTVYNLRVADFHTYFVGGGLWGFDVWVHNASTSYALGTKGANQLVDSVAGEIEKATTAAELVLKAGRSGGTPWGRHYQRYKGTGHWIEKLAYGNAIQQIADNSLRSNQIISPLILNGKLLVNKGSQLGIGKKALLRPDFQLDLGSGQWAIFDISTISQRIAGKITSKYTHADSPYLVDISY